MPEPFRIRLRSRSAGACARRNAGPSPGGVRGGGRRRGSGTLRVGGRGWSRCSTRPREMRVRRSSERRGRHRPPAHPHRRALRHRRGNAQICRRPGREDAPQRAERATDRRQGDLRLPRLCQPSHAEPRCGGAGHRGGLGRRAAGPGTTGTGGGLGAGHDGVDDGVGPAQRPPEPERESLLRRSAARARAAAAGR